MGHDISLQLREGNLMTKIMLRKQQQVIEDLQDNKMDVTRPINQLGDTILHYAAYNHMKKLIEYLLKNQADPHVVNNRGLSPLDVATPQIRQWIIHQWNKTGTSRKTSYYSPRGKTEPAIFQTLFMHKQSLQ